MNELIKGLTETDYHPCGTCKMENSDEGVVNEKLQVHGVENLRVVDGSIIPRIISANLNAPIQMIAHRAADYILNQPQLNPIKAQFLFEKSQIQIFVGTNIFKGLSPTVILTGKFPK